MINVLRAIKYVVKGRLPKANLLPKQTRLGTSERRL